MATTRLSRGKQILASLILIAAISLLLRYFNAMLVNTTVVKTLTPDSPLRTGLERSQEETSIPSTTSSIPDNSSRNGNFSNVGNESNAMNDSDVPSLQDPADAKFSDALVKHKPSKNVNNVTMIIHRPVANEKAVLLGIGIGTYPTVIKILSHSSVVYSFGIGGDVSWERSLLDRIQGIRIHAFDGSSAASHWLTRRQVGKFHTAYEDTYSEEFQNPRNLPRLLPMGVTLYPWVLARISKRQTLYCFEKEGGELGLLISRDTFSLVRQLNGYNLLWTEGVEGKILQDTMKTLGHSRLGLMKLSVEGLEMQLLKAWVKWNISVPICQILIHFLDQKTDEGIESWKEGIKLLEQLDYELIHCHQGTHDPTHKCAFLSRKHC